MNRVLGSALCALLLATCVTPATPIVPPDWTAIPLEVVDAFCARLQTDAIATGSPVTIVSTTRPLATARSMGILPLTVGAPAGTMSNNASESMALMNRTMPITTQGSACPWRVIPAERYQQHFDEVIVELSAPALHPFSPREAGMFARVTVGGEAASWYWIHLVQTPDGWRPARVSVLVQ